MRKWQIERNFFLYFFALLFPFVSDNLSDCQFRGTLGNSNGIDEDERLNRPFILSFSRRSFSTHTRVTTKSNFFYQLASVSSYSFVSTRTNFFFRQSQVSQVKESSYNFIYSQTTQNEEENTHLFIWVKKHLKTLSEIFFIVHIMCPSYFLHRMCVLRVQRLRWTGKIFVENADRIKVFFRQHLSIFFNIHSHHHLSYETETAEQMFK
jgi:hypothetical protein